MGRRRGSAGRSQQSAVAKGAQGGKSKGGVAKGSRGGHAETVAPKPGLSRRSPSAPKPEQLEHIPAGTHIDTGRRPTGTREWSEHSVNLYNGCSHNCRYCYGCEMALRFKRKKSAADWPTMELNEKELTKKRRKLKGRVMFPTTHDITPETIEPCIRVLKNLLEAGNEVLIVTKPHLSCVERMMDELAAFREQIIFRFTIGCLEDAIRVFWEPDAPMISERLRALETAHAAGFVTSVSAEPMLFPVGIDDLINACLPFVTDTMWLGLMNKVAQRVRLESAEALHVGIEALNKLHNTPVATPEEAAQQDQRIDKLKRQVTALSEVAARDQAQVDRLLRGQSEPVIHDIYLRWRHEPKIRWKDSIRELLRLDL